MHNDNSIVFLTIALICAWLFLDNFFGKGYIKALVNNIFEG